MRRLRKPPWAELQGFSPLFFGKSKKGWRVLWVFGGWHKGSGYSNTIWRSNDGGSTWEEATTCKRWCPRARAGVAAGATSPGQSGPKAITYVVGGDTNQGLKSDVWASDTLCCEWHCMNEDAPFGKRADVACSTVSGDPLSLLVAGGIDVEPCLDCWLSRDIGVTFTKVDMPELPIMPQLTQWPPHFLCVSACTGFALKFWQFRLDQDKHDSPQAELQALDADDDDEWALTQNYETIIGAFSAGARRPPRVALDLQTQVAMWWDAATNCLATRPLIDGIHTEHLHETAGPPTAAAVLCDMDSPFASLRHGRLWVLPYNGAGVFTTDRLRYRAQLRFLMLLGVRLAMLVGLPLDVWIARVPAMLLPGPRRVSVSSS